MATNELFAENILNVVVTDPTTPASGDPCRYGFATGVAVTDEGGGGNIATETSVDFGMKTWNLPVTDSVGGGIAVGDTLFYNDAADDVRNNPAGYFFGIALDAVGVGATTTIRVLHLPSPGSGTIGAGTINTANLAAGLLSADAPGRAKMATNYLSTTKLLDAIAADQVTNAVLLQIVLNGAFQADAATRALFADAIWPEAKIVPDTLTPASMAEVADGALMGGFPISYRFSVPDAATGDVDFVLTHKTRITDAHCIKTGGAGGAANTIQIQTGGGVAISDIMSINIADTAIVRCATLDDATWEIADGGTLRIHRVKVGGNAECQVVVRGFRVA